MIPRAYITAWRAHAPWPDDDLVEQDLVLSRAPHEIFSHPLLAHELAFRGGTALHKLVFPSPLRYSEDIDLVQLAAGPIRPVMQAIHRQLDGWLGSPSTRQGESGVKMIYSFETESEPRGKRKLEVEIHTREHFTVLGPARVPLETSNPWFSGVGDRKDVSSIRRTNKLSAHLSHAEDRSRLSNRILIRRPLARQADDLMTPLGPDAHPDTPLPPALLEAVERSIAAAPVEFDLSSGEGFRLAVEAAEEFGRLGTEPGELKVLEGRLAAREAAAPLVTQLALKLARSRAYVRSIDEPSFVSVVFAVYKEHERVLAPEQHPHGEDFLRRKARQLEWLCAGSPLDWELVVVDDGCPEGSGRVIEDIAREEGYGERVRVLFLADAIERGLAVTRPLETTDESRKGGSIAYGMWSAVQTPRPNHALVFTDADLSTHLGQTGLLLHELRDGALAAVGSRREPTSVVVKGAGRNDRGKLFIYLWKRMLAPLQYITDTQCGFKAFDGRIVPELVDGLLEKKFAFDIELMLRCELLRPGSIAKVAIAWIDSEALSTTTDIQPYLSMLQMAAAMYRKYLPAEPGAESFAAFIEELDEPRWQWLLEQIPAEITARDPAGFDEFDAVSAAQLRAASKASA